MAWLNTILDVIFPAKCLSCGKSGSDLCIKCLGEIPEAERESEGWIFPMYDYRHGVLKKTIWLLKYKGKKHLAKVFAEVLYGRILEELADLSVLENFNNVLLIPIPLSPKRYRDRGFNQSELICRELIKLDRDVNLRLERNILIKPEDTLHQAQIENRNERIRNVVGSFAIRNEESKKLLEGKNIILIDDITTTGATLNEAKKTLKKFGARKVIAFTIAH